MWPEEDIISYRRRTAPRQPWDERLPDGTPAIAVGMPPYLAQMMAGQPNLVAPILERPRIANPPTMPPPPGGPVPTNTPVPPIELGPHVGPNASRLERLLAERQALSTADPSSKVRRTDWGYEVGPPEQSPSRFRHAAMGAGTGAIIAGQATGGDPWGTLAGAVTGALTGGVSPALLQAFNRRAELDRNAGELSTEQKLQLQNAQMAETAAQAEQRRLEPYLKAEELRAQNERFEATERGRNERAAQSNRTRAQAAAEANRLRAEALEETKRHNRETERKPGSKYRTVANTIFEVDDDGIWRVAPGAPPPFSPTDAARAEREGVRSTERMEKGRQAEALFRKGSEYWDQAKAKRAEADRLRLKPDGTPRQFISDTVDAQIRTLIREAESLEAKTREVQIRGDLLAAEAESGSAASTGGRTLEGAIEAFRKDKKRNPTGREPTAEEIERMRKALNR